MATKTKSSKKSLLKMQADRQASCVTLREKPISKGRSSLYLDYYEKGKGRKYEFLGLYLIKETDEASRLQNKNTFANAMAIRNLREQQVTSNIGGFKQIGSKLTLLDWMEQCKQRKSGKRQNTIINCIHHLEAMGAASIMLDKVDKEFCHNFIEYLKNAKSFKNTKNQRKIAPSTGELYYICFASCMAEAQERELIMSNPCSLISKDAKIKSKQAKREFLDIEEIKRLANTTIDKKHFEETKRAFLFSCFTGIRVSDIRGLTWNDIKTENGNMYVEILMQKTKERLKLKLNNNAIALLGEDRGYPGGAVFDTCNDESTINYHLKIYAKKAGIDKHLSFHCARHTFAVTQITLGTNIYVISKLLGHKNIATTEVYADIVNETRDNAMDKMNDINI